MEQMIDELKREIFHLKKLIVTLETIKDQSFAMIRLCKCRSVTTNKKQKLIDLINDYELQNGKLNIEVLESHKTISDSLDLNFDREDHGEDYCDVKETKNSKKRKNLRSVENRSSHDGPDDVSKRKRQKKRRERNVKCEFIGCSMMFRETAEMKNHLWRHFGKKYSCEWPGCEKRFATQSSLKTHREVHLNKRRFNCQWNGCDEVFLRKEQLKVHIADVHTGLKKFKCDWPGCEFTSSYLHTINNHKRRHSGDRPYKCVWPHCEWAFRQEHHLKTHMLKHTGEKPFECDHCEKRFQSKQAMKCHTNKVHA